MKKKALSKVVSLTLSFAVVASAFASLGVVAYAEEEKIEIPKPVGVYDFSYNFEELAEQDPGFSVVQNDAAPELVQDEEMGQVLQLNKAIIENREFVQKVDNETGQVSSTGYIASEDTQYSQIDITNPYQGLDYLKEYEPYEDVETKLYRQMDQPYWKEGITISYWIKTPAGEDGYGLNSNVVGFTSNRFQMQSDDYAYHMTTLKFDLEYASLTDEERKLYGPAVEACGVLPYSDFYFELATDELYLDCPVYKAPSLSDRIGRIYWMNKFFTQGTAYIRQGDGKIDPCGEKNRYEMWNVAPTLGDTEEDHDPGESRIRYTWTYSEMWLDASSSFFFENDTENVNKQLNPNHTTSFGSVVGMQHCDSFNINSWKKATNVAEADAQGLAGPSPVMEPDEWHHVVCVIQNDWVLYYLDGEEIDIEEWYSSFGTQGLAETVGTGYKPWKRFNKGTGSRYGYGNNKTITYWCYYGNYCAPTMMEWIIKDCVNAKIGGGNIAGDGYTMYADTDEIQLKNVVFYDKMLTNEQIEYLASDPFYYDKKNNETGLLGDVEIDEIINANDALAVLKHAATLAVLEGQSYDNADVNSDGIINAGDALEILKYAAGLITEFTPADVPEEV